MKAATPPALLIGSLLIASTALAKPAEHAHRSRHHHRHHTTAMHTTQVHSKDDSRPGRADLPPLVSHHAGAAHSHVAEHRDAHEGSAKDADHDASPSRDRKKDGKKKTSAPAREVGHHAKAHGKHHHKKKAKPKPPCLRDPITLTRGIEQERFSLTKCDGAVAPLAVDHISMLARPGSMLRPDRSFAQLAKKQGPFLAPGIKRMNPGLPVRLQAVVDHFARKGKPVTLHLISGYRPQSHGSYHAKASAMDFNMEGVSNEALVAFCKTLDDTGCGYYPNSTFIHMDVRPTGTGHVAWIDASGPGERPHYVASWPPPPEPKPTELGDRLAKILPGVPVDSHPAEVMGGAVPPPPAAPLPGDVEGLETAL